MKLMYSMHYFAPWRFYQRETPPKMCSVPAMIRCVSTCVEIFLIFGCFWVAFSINKQESIPVGCIPPDRPLQVNMFEHVSYLNHQMSLAGGRCPQMNKFEQVSSVDDQMSLVGGGGAGVMGGMYGKVHCIMSNDHMGTLCGQTGMTAGGKYF